MESYLIYKHTNKINGKCYIGQTRETDKPEARWQSGRGYSRQPKFYRAISKHGWDAFDHEILEHCESLAEANFRECYWIAYFDSVNTGYNSSNGGGIPQYFSKAVYQLDQNKNIINKFESTRQAERFTGVSQANITKCCRGITNSANGYWWCYVQDYDTFIIKPIGSSKGQPLAVEQLSLTGDVIATYDSTAEAERNTHIPHQNISKCCTGKLLTAGKYKWRYKNEERKNQN